MSRAWTGREPQTHRPRCGVTRKPMTLQPIRPAERHCFGGPVQRWVEGEATPQRVAVLRRRETVQPARSRSFTGCPQAAALGARPGEALGLRWDDIHLTERVLYVRCTLSAVDNNHLVITPPKTRTSKNWVAISPRVAAALRHRARSTPRAHSDPHAPFTGLVFCRPDGRPLQPRTVLDRLRQLSDEAGVPRVTVHDLRHLAATLTITDGVPPSPWSPRPCATPPCPPRPTSTATSPSKPPAKPSTPSNRPSHRSSREPTGRPG